MVAEFPALLPTFRTRVAKPTTRTASLQVEARNASESAMELALVVAIVRGDKLGAVEKKLHEFGVRGITVIKAKGFGEHSLPHDILGHALMQDQAKLEVYVARDQAERVAAALIDAAHTGLSGDGIVAILPVQRVFSVRTRSETIPNRACG